MVRVNQSRCTVFINRHILGILLLLSGCKVISALVFKPGGSQRPKSNENKCICSNHKKNMSNHENERNGCELFYKTNHILLARHVHRSIVNNLITLLLLIDLFSKSAPILIRSASF